MTSKKKQRDKEHNASSHPLLEIRNLQIEATIYPPGGIPHVLKIIDDVSLTLQRGKVLGIIGESGAGKSSVGLSSMGYGRGGCRIVGGTVRIHGVNILEGGAKGFRRLRGNTVTYVSQSAAASFNPALRLMDQVVEAAVKHGRFTRYAAEQRAVGLFRTLSLPNPEIIGSRYPHQVSGGQLQRVMTAMALCPEPELIVFDEPTTSLDVTTQIDVLAAIKTAIRNTGVAALYITHDLAVVAQVADEIIVLRNGKLIEHGSTSKIISVPSDLYTQALVAANEVVHNQIDITGSEPLLAIEKIAAGYKGTNIKVLNDVTLEVFSGQTLAVVGESGSGKSTLARVITGLLPPSSGSVFFNGRELQPKLADRSKGDLRELQMIYQMADVAMNPRQRVGTIIGRPLEFYFGIHGAELERKVSDLLDKTEMSRNIASRFPGELSGGQKQRVCIARALAANPKLVICDEVTSALDPLVAKGILRLLLDLQVEHHVAYVFITHDLSTVRSIADSIAVMHRGKLVRYGSKSEVLNPPFDSYTELLLSSVPKMEIGWLEAAIADREVEAVSAVAHSFMRTA